MHYLDVTLQLQRVAEEDKVMLVEYNVRLFSAANGLTLT